MRFLAPRALLFLLSAAALSAADRVAIAAAANLVYALDALHAAFHATEPDTQLVVTPGASGSLVAQIRNGAPFDVFLSADTDYPAALVASGDAEGPLVPFATGRLVLWTLRSELDLGSIGVAVRNPSVHKIALAQPDTAPYGRAARDALKKLEVWADAQPKIVLGDNIAQAAQFVQSGNADCGFVALSFVLAPRLATKGHYIEVPADLHEPLTQAAVLTRLGRENAAARRYLAFLTSPAAQEILARSGYAPPTPAP